MNENERQRFRMLRGREIDGDALTAEESEELSRGMAWVLEEEDTRLAASETRKQHDLESLQASNRELRLLIEREEKFVARLENLLAEINQEKRELHRESSRLLAVERAA